MPLPDAAGVVAAARSVGLTTDERQAAQLLRYLALLQHWNATYNLTAVRDPEAMWTQHLLDCMAALPPVQARLADRPRPRVLDVGSGGGMPGLVWAVLWPAADITCIDTVGKKAAFVRQAAGQLGLANLHALQGRVEQAHLPAFDLVTCRAFASLADFTRLSRHLLGPGGCWLALKGRRPDDEIASLPPEVTMFHVEPLQVPGLDAARCLVWMRPSAA